MGLSRRDPRVSRRAVLSGGFGMLGESKGGSGPATAHVSIGYRDGFIYWPLGMARAAIGAGGVRPDKREGDRATPPGIFSLPFGMYREDRINLPDTALPMIPLRKVHAWVDDPNDPKYNQLVEPTLSLTYRRALEERRDLRLVGSRRLQYGPDATRCRQRYFLAYRSARFLTHGWLCRSQPERSSRTDQGVGYG